MLTIKNDAEWDIIVPMLMRNAMEDVVQQALKVLKKYVEDIVYAYNPKSGVYTRSGEFAQAWDVITRSMMGKSGSILFGYDPDSMESIPQDGTWQHGSLHWDGGTDSRDFLADFLFKGIEAEHSMFGEIPMRDAWTPFKVEFDASWRVWWSNALRKQGLI